jgi:hypothetical protein
MIGREIRPLFEKEIAKLPADDRNKLLRQLELAFASQTEKQPGYARLWAG